MSVTLRWLRIIAVSFVITCVLYGSTRCGFLRSDDITWIRAVEHKQFLRLSYEQFVHGSPYDYRPITSVILWLESHIFGDFAPPYYALNFLLHAVNTAFVYSLAIIIVRNQRYAVVAALIFLVHPAPFRTVIWISDLATLLQTMFTLVAFRLWFGYSRSSNALLLAGSQASAIAAMFAKESGVIVPALLLLLDFIVQRGKVPRRLVLYLPLAPAVAVYLLLALQPMPGWREYPAVYHASWRVIPNALYGIGFAVVPIAATLLAVGIGALFLLTTAMLIKSKSEVLFLLLWVILGVLPTAPFAPGSFNETGRYAYSLLPPIAIIVGIWFERLAGAIESDSNLSQRLVAAVGISVILFASVMTCRLARTPYTTQPGIVLYHYVVFSIMGYSRAQDFFRAEFRCTSPDAVSAAYEWANEFVDKRKDRKEFLLPGLLVRGISETLQHKNGAAASDFNHAEDLAGGGVDIVRGARVNPEFVRSLTSRWRGSPECLPSL